MYGSETESEKICEEVPGWCGTAEIPVFAV
jgi:hypothetical protein